MDPVLELRKVSKHYPGHRAVHDVSLSVESGAFYSILGPSGCGKTTALRMIAGFDAPTAGEILLRGKPIGHLRPYERPINTVFQRYALFPHLTVRGNVEFGLRRRGATADLEQKVQRALDMVQLTGKESRMPPQLSGGEQQRVALARSLVLEPEVLLLDEPLSALDPNLRKSVRLELKALQRRTGITFVFITHDQEEALSLSDCIAVMNKGEIEQIGTPHDIYLRPATPFVAGFLGAVNWIDGQKTGVRPEATRIGREAPAGDLRIQTAEVRNAVFLGNCVHIETRTSAGGRIVAEVPCDQNPYREGDSVYVWWKPTDELRFG
jgi:ABC-type Fe3+/spermidine/putrescine transport system ATPase subunit